ncbi:MAG TPA: dihydrofolate reductase [Polyangia bacterium]|jgi:dihydrofolate reductase|nr:dihydrofolate reductase [Polyangia bacterium]
MTAPAPLTFIVAVARNGVMGKDGQLPWDLPEDRAFFRDQTMGHAIIMGRRTWDERGAPLPGRRNIVVSRTGNVSGTGRDVVRTIEQAISLARETDRSPFVVGGAEIFRLAMPYATRVLLTEIDFDADGDTFFTPLDPAQWEATSRRRGDRATYVTYDRRANSR